MLTCKQMYRKNQLYCFEVKKTLITQVEFVTVGVPIVCCHHAQEAFENTTVSAERLWCHAWNQKDAQFGYLQPF